MRERPEERTDKWMRERPEEGETKELERPEEGEDRQRDEREQRGGWGENREKNQAAYLYCSAGRESGTAGEERGSTSSR